MKTSAKDSIGRVAAALGTRGGPASYRRAVEGAGVALHQRFAQDARWSFLYKDDTRYAREPTEPQAPGVPSGTRAGAVQGPVLKPPVWTWEVPAYLWLGGIAAGASFAALGCEVVGDRRSALVSRAVAVSALSAGPPLLIADLGRPLRFLNMLRVFKPRSPMSMGAWCLVCTSTSSSASLFADVVGRPRLAQTAGVVTAFFSVYLGSYTGALLVSTAVPLWSGARLRLGPLFALTSASTGAAAVRATLIGARPNTPATTHRGLALSQTATMAAELVLAEVTEHTVGPHKRMLRRGRAGWLMRAGKACAVASLGLELSARRSRRGGLGAAGLCLAAGLLFRYGWISAGRASASDDDLAAATARGEDL